MNQRKISIITDQIMFGGTGMYTMRLFELMQSVFSNVSMYNVHPFSPISISKNKNFHFQSTRNSILIPMFINKNLKTLKINGVFDNDFIHYTGINIAEILKSNCNCIFTVHDYYHLGIKALNVSNIRDLIIGIYREFFLIKYGHFLGKAQNIVVPSHNTANVINKEFHKNSTVIHHWVDRSIFKPRDKIKFRKFLGLPVNKTILINVGGTGANKNMKLINKIMDSLDANYLLVKVGGKVNSKNTINAGKVPAKLLPYYYNASDIYLHTSLYEGFGIPLIEAISSGLPVVALNQPTTREILGEKQYLIDSHKDESKYVDLIRELSDRKYYNEISSTNLLRSASYSKENALNAYKKLYLDVFKCFDLLT